MKKFILSLLTLAASAVSLALFATDTTDSAALPCGLQVSDNTATHWYTITNHNKTDQCVGIDPATIGSSDESVKPSTKGYPIANAGNAVTMWKLVMRSDGAIDIVNQNGYYFTPDDVTANNSALHLSSTSPATGWEIRQSHIAGEVIVSSVGHTANGAFFNVGDNGEIKNWHSHGNNCTFGVNENRPACSFAFNEIQYAVNAGKDATSNISGSRATSDITLISTKYGTQSISDLQDYNSSHPIYFDKTGSIPNFKVVPGEIVQVHSTYQKSGGNIHKYFYIDFEGDGFNSTLYSTENPTGNLISYSYHNNQNSLGETLSYAQTNDVPDFVIPADLAPGDYRFRFKSDWDNIDPAGSNGMITNGAIIVDGIIHVADYYDVTFGKDATHSESRIVSSISLNGKYGSFNIPIDNSTSPHPLYRFLSDKYIMVEAGEHVSVALGNSVWMNSYVYIDKDNDGYFDWNATAADKLNGDIVSFSNIDFKNSEGVANEDGNVQALPEFDVPEMAPGIYRMRFKSDWDSGEPAGSNISNKSIISVGGYIIDIPLIVVDPTSTPSNITLTGTATNGTAALGEGKNLNLTPAVGYTIGTLTASGSRTFTGAENAFGNPTSVAVNFSNVQFSGPTIPASLSLCENVTVDVTNAFTAIPEHEGYTLVWNDEFNTADGTHPEISENAYKVTDKGTSTWAKATSSRPELMEMDGQGNLVMTAKQFDDSNYLNRWETGVIETSPSFGVKYGRIEARIKTNKNPGTFPAFWMMPVKNEAYVIENGEEVLKKGWPYGGEIDIFETVAPPNNSFKAYATVHGDWSVYNNNSGYGSSISTDVSQFHIYAVEWDETTLKFFCDNAIVHTVNKNDSQLRGSWPFDKEFYIILNQSVGGNTDYSGGGWPGLPTDGTVYQTEVDWVRVYQKTADLAPTLIVTDADGNKLESQTLRGGEEAYVKVITPSTAITAASLGDTPLTAVDGKPNLFKFTPEPGNETININLSATYPASSTPVTNIAPVEVTYPYTIIYPNDDEETMNSIHYYVVVKKLVPGTGLVNVANGETVEPGTTLVVEHSIYQPSEESFAPYRLMSCSYNSDLINYTKENELFAEIMANTRSRNLAADYKNTTTIQLTAEVEYLPKVTFPEGVTVMNGETAVTSGERFMKGTALTATLAAVDRKKVTYAVPGEADATLYPGDESATKTITIALKEGTTKDNENDIAITADTKDVKQLILPDLSTANYTLAITGEDGTEVEAGWIEADTELTFTVTPAEGYTIDAATLGGEDMTIDETSGKASKVYTVTATDDIPMLEVTATRYLAVTIADDLQNVAITLPDGIDATKIAAGTSVTATITADTGYRITAVTANGEDAELEEDVDLTGKVTVTTYTFIINDPVALAATAEYMPTITFREGVTVAEGTETITSGTRVIAGEIAVTLSPIDGKKTTFTIPDEAESTILYPGDEAVEKTITVTTDTEITAAPTDVVLVTLPTIEGATITTDPEGHNGYFDAGAKVTFTVKIADGYELEEDATPSIAGVNLDTEMKATIILATDITADAFILPVKASVKMNITTPAENSGIAVSTTDNPKTIDDGVTEVVFEAVDGKVAGHEDHGGAHTHLTIRHDADATVNLPAEHKAKDGFEFVPESSNEDVATATIEDGKIIVKHNKRVGSAIIRIFHRAKKAEPSTVRLLDETTDTETSTDTETEQPMATLYVDVKIPASTAVSFEAVGSQSISISYGRTRQLAVALNPTEVTNPILWESTDNAIVTVDAEGLITAIAAGTTTVTASVDGLDVEPVIFTITVTVPSGPIGSGIDAINADAEAGLTTIYDLQGHRLERISAPGFYIVNGVKTLVR